MALREPAPDIPRLVSPRWPHHALQLRQDAACCREAKGTSAQRRAPKSSWPVPRSSQAGSYGTRQPLMWCDAAGAGQSVLEPHLEPDKGERCNSRRSRRPRASSMRLGGKCGNCQFLPSQASAEAGRQSRCRPTAHVRTSRRVGTPLLKHGQATCPRRLMRDSTRHGELRAFCDRHFPTHFAGPAWPLVELGNTQPANLSVYFRRCMACAATLTLCSEHRSPGDEWVFDVSLRLQRAKAKAILANALTANANDPAPGGGRRRRANGARQPKLPADG